MNELLLTKNSSMILVKASGVLGKHNSCGGE